MSRQAFNERLRPKHVDHDEASSMLFEAWQAATNAALERAAEVCDEQAKEPAWHVAPTVPGLWLNSVFMKVEDVEQWHIDCQLHLECARWYGPIPPDGDKP